MANTGTGHTGIDQASGEREMRLGITTIQKNRAPWLKEWVIFHRLVGFQTFYVFLHETTDESKKILDELSRFIDIRSYFIAKSAPLPQRAAYEYICAEHLHEMDWMAFLDGDEFLFTTNGKSLVDNLSIYSDMRISALGVYWRCFGSGGHISEPDGLLTENFLHRAPDDFSVNRHVKSLVRGGSGSRFGANPHVFQTPRGTFDSQLRPIGLEGISNYPPCYERFCIHHYITQSRDYFFHKKRLGGRADVTKDHPEYIRSTQQWDAFNRNDVFDPTLRNFAGNIKKALQDLKTTRAS